MQFRDNECVLSAVVYFAAYATASAVESTDRCAEVCITRSRCDNMQQIWKTSHMARVVAVAYYHRS